MKTLLIARKSLIEILREPQLLFLELLMPIIFLGITASTYNAPLQATYPIQVTGSTPNTAPVINQIESQHYADGKPVFALSEMDDPQNALQEREIAAALSIASDADGAKVRVTIEGDALYPHFYRASVILHNVLNHYADRLSGRPLVVRIVEEPLFVGGPQTEFDIYAPGMIIFALLMIVPQTAMLVAREVRWNTLRRLRLTRLSAWELLGGISLSQMVIAVIQVLVVFFAALLMGFNNQGALWLALVVGLAVSFSAIGQGLVVAGFVENDSQAANLGSTLTMTQVFLSGAFYRLPPLTLFTLAGHQIDLFDIFPATHGLMALQQVLTYGDGLAQIGFRLGLVLLLSALYFAGGVLIFRRLQMRKSGY